MSGDGPFGRASFLDPWWRYLSPPGFSRIGEGLAASAFGTLGVTFSAGFGAADFAMPAWGEETQDLVAIHAKRGLLLPRVVEGSPLADLISGMKTTEIPYDIAPRMSLTQGWEAVMDRRTARTRSTIRRKARKLSEIGPLEVRHITDGDDLALWLPSAFRLYEARAASVRRGRLWQTTRGKAFLASWMGELAGEGALDLSFLLVGGEPQAFAFCIADADSCYLYGLGFDPASPLARWSPGEQLLIHLMKSASEKGCQYFDFLVGDEPYKRAWATENRLVQTVALGPNRAVREALLAWPRLTGAARTYLHPTA